MWSIPYVLEIEISRARPTAVSQAANTSRMIGIILVREECVFEAMRADIMKSAITIPSRHRREAIKCER